MDNAKDRAARARSAGVLFIAIVVVAGAIGLVTKAEASPAGAAGLDLPPAQKAALAKTFRAELKPFGLRVSRGLLQDGATYEPDPKGTHLALYVEPMSSNYSTRDYVKNYAKIARVFVPMVFERWESLQSFDICQEPFDDARKAPPPVTQVFVTRSALDRVDWDRASLVDMLAAAPANRRQRGVDYYVYFNADLRSESTFQAAAEAAGYDANW